MPAKPCCGRVIRPALACRYKTKKLPPKCGRNLQLMTLVPKRVLPVAAMVALFTPLAFPQAKGAEDETLRQAAEKTRFWVGTTIQGRMGNRDPEYKPELSREFNAAVSIVFQGITRRQLGRFTLDAMDMATSSA